MRTHEDSDVLQVCHCLLCRFISLVVPAVEDIFARIEYDSYDVLRLSVSV